MAKGSYVVLEQRGLLAVAGEDARTFLQGLISNDVAKVTPERAIHGAFLTPQGKFLHDFFVVEVDGTLMLDCEGGARLADLTRRLGVYKLRSKVTLNDRGAELGVAVVHGPGALEALGLPDQAGAARPLAGGVAWVDSRLVAMGARVMLPREALPDALENLGLAAGSLEDWDAARMTLGVPDGSRDLIVEKSILLENGFEELQGVDFAKGCYLGQEVTARTKYRALIKKRLLPVTISGPIPAPGTEVMMGEREVGEMRSAVAGIGLALLRLEALDEAVSFTAGKATLTPGKPEWVSF